VLISSSIVILPIDVHSSRGAARAVMGSLRDEG